MKKFLYLVGGAVLVTVFVVFQKYTENVSLPELEICNHKSCHKTTEYFLKNMDIDVNPCDNFYKYACGRLKEERAGTLFTIINENGQNLLKAISQPVDPNEPKAIRLLKSLYKSCLDEEKITARGLEPLLKDLKNFGGWPVLEGSKWRKNGFQWQTILGKLAKHININFAISVNVYGDEDDSSRHIINIDQAMQIDPEHHTFLEGFENVYIQFYLQSMIDSVVALGGHRRIAEIEMKNAVKLEIEIAKLIKTDDQLTDYDYLYNRMTVDELQEREPGIMWINFLNLIPFPRYISGKEEIVVNFPNFVRDLIKLFNKTPKRIVANFFLWQFVRQHLPLVDFKASPKLSSFFELNVNREAFCINKIDKCSIFSKGLTYIRKVFNKESKPVATSLMDSLKNVLYKNLRKNEWLKAKTKRKAKIKLAFLKYDIGYPSQAFDDELMDNLFKNIEIYDDFYENLKSSCQIATEIMLGSLTRNPDDNKWLISISYSFQPNAGYFASHNYITMLAGILSEIVVDPQRPNYVNYGFLGAIVGHEIIHVFDSKGRNYDFKGKLRDWWDTKSLREFEARERCFVDKYNNYTDSITGLKVDGEQTLAENIADSGGFRLSYQAYLHWLQTKEIANEPLLPNLSLNQKQIFWLSLANFFCLNLNKDERENNLRTDMHSLSEFRIVGAFSNLNEFAADFNCPKGSPMNPIKKCTVW